jgi:hypothetical protein
MYKEFIVVVLDVNRIMGLDYVQFSNSLLTSLIALVVASTLYRILCLCICIGLMNFLFLKEDIDIAGNSLSKAVYMANANNIFGFKNYLGSINPEKDTFSVGFVRCFSYVIVRSELALVDLLAVPGSQNSMTVNSSKSGRTKISRGSNDSNMELKMN